MPLTVGVATGTCDCCGVDLGEIARRNFTYVPLIDMYLCKEKRCDEKFATNLLITSFNAEKALHTALIILGVIPLHP